MKKILGSPAALGTPISLTLLCFICLLPGLITAQTPQTALEDAAFDQYFVKHVAAPVVTGKFINASAQELSTLYISYTCVTPYNTYQVKKTTKIAADGSFKLEIDYNLPYQQIFFKVGDIFYAALYANKDLYIQLDINKLKQVKNVAFNGEGIKYLGTDGPVNTYLNNFILFRRDDQLDNSRRKQIILFDREIPAKEKVKRTDSLAANLAMIYQEYITTTPSPYAYLLENARLSDYYADLLSAQFGIPLNDTTWEKIKAHKTYLISNEGSSFYNNLSIHLSMRPFHKSSVSWKDVATLPDLTVAEHIIIDSIRSFENRHQKYLSPEYTKWNSQLAPRLSKILVAKRRQIMLQTIDSIFNPGMADILKFSIVSTDPNVQKEIAELVLPTMHTEWCKFVLNEEYKKLTAKISNINSLLASASPTSAIGLGQPVMETPFGAKLYKLNDLSVDQAILQLRKTFEGKAILLDFWATWCGPCIAEMPHSKRLQQESQNLPIVFVYLCTSNGSDEEKWKMKVAELKQPGIHFFVEDKLESGLMTQFSVSGYPSYLFFDTTGKYIPGAIKWMSKLDMAILTELVSKKAGTE